MWAAAFSFCINALTLSIPLYSIQIFDRVLSSGSTPTLIVLTVAVLAGLASATALEEIRARLLVALGMQFDGQLASDVFERQLGGDGSAGTSGTAVRDLDTVRHALTGGGIISLFDLPWSPLFLAACFYLHPVLGVVSLVGVGLVLGLALANQALISAPLAQSHTYTEESYRQTDSALSNVETVRAMGMLPDVMARWSHIRSLAISSQAVASTRNALISSIIKFVRYALQIVIMAAGAWLAIHREISPGALFAASLVCSRALMPVDQLVAVWKQLLSGWDAWKRVDQVLSQPAVHRSMPLPAPKGRVEAEGVCYTIAGSQQAILTEISFAVEPGEALGIVGPSAAGKSTLARVIVGALRPTSGSVRLDGAETWAWDRRQFGQFVGYVSQGIELFEGTIAENIARFRAADSLDIVEAAQLAGVHEMILSLPKGYETRLSRQGAPLSGGQRQRLALARAVFGKPRLIVLDEPNSNLDAAGDGALQHLLGHMKVRGTTVLMIAHRPSILVSLDKVLVLNNGTVADFGPVERVMPKIAPGFPIGQKRIVGQQ